MAIVCRSDNFEPLNEGRPFMLGVLDADEVVQRNVKTGEMLFQAGEERTLYRIERGAVCHYALWSDGRHDVIEFAFPGDIIGLGHLREHTSTAQAMVDTVISVITEDELASAIESDDRLSFRQAAAVEREFDYLRDRAVSAETPATVRLANFLLALSSTNGPEGRDADLISDDVTAGFVAEKLDISIEKLGDALVRLKKEGAVRETSTGLRIADKFILQRLADAA